MQKLFETITLTLIEGKMQLIEEITTVQIKCVNVYQVCVQKWKGRFEKLLRSLVYFFFQKPCYFKNWKYFKDLLLIIIHPPPFNYELEDYNSCISKCQPPYIQKTKQFISIPTAKLGKEACLSLDQSGIYYLNFLIIVTPSASSCLINEKGERIQQVKQKCGS